MIPILFFGLKIRFKTDLKKEAGMEKENTRLEFYIALIELYEDIVQKQAKLNRQLIDFLKKEKEPIEIKIDSEKISDIYQKSLSTAFLDNK